MDLQGPNLPVPACQSIDDVPPCGGCAALLVVDVQPCWYSQSPMLREAFPALPANVSAVIGSARERCMPVIHVRADYEGSQFMETLRRLNPGEEYEPTATTEGESFASELPDEPVVLKSTFDGFLNTNLENVLSSYGVTRVFLCGLVTSASVLSTALGAFHRGLDVVLIADCCGDKTAERHNVTLAMYTHYVFRTAMASDLPCIPCGAAAPSHESAMAVAESAGRVARVARTLVTVAPLETIAEEPVAQTSDDAGRSAGSGSGVGGSAMKLPPDDPSVSPVSSMTDIVALEAQRRAPKRKAEALFDVDDWQNTLEDHLQWAINKR